MRIASGVVVAWAALAVWVCIEVFPDYPRTRLGWFLLLTAGPPLLVVGSWLSERSPFARASPARFSGAWFASMAGAVLVGSAVVALGVWISTAFGW